MPPPIVNSLIQSCVLSATSNIIAQFITIYRSNAPFSIDWTRVFYFVLYTLLSAPPNFLWQSFLESTFPSRTLVPSTSAVAAAAANNEKELDREEKTSQLLESKLSVRNTLIKFAIDQTLGAVANTMMFSLYFADLRGEGLVQAWKSASQEVLPLMAAGVRLWPAVSLINFGLVRSVQGRALVGSIAGLGWGVYLSLMKT